MTRTMAAVKVVMAAALILAGCAPLAPGFYDAATIEDSGLASCTWTRRFSPPIVYQEATSSCVLRAGGLRPASRDPSPSRCRRGRWCA